MSDDEPCRHGITGPCRSCSTGATQEELNDADRDEFDDVCDQNERLRGEVSRLKLALGEATRALEAVPCDGRCWDDAHEGDKHRFGPSEDCPKTKARAALEAIRKLTP